MSGFVKLTYIVDYICTCYITNSDVITSIDINTPIN